MSMTDAGSSVLITSRVDSCCRKKAEEYHCGPDKSYFISKVGILCFLNLMSRINFSSIHFGMEKENSVVHVATVGGPAHFWC